MLQLKCALGVLTVLLGGVHTATASASAPRTLTVEAPRSGYVDVRITRPMSFDLDNAAMRGGRNYVGIVFDRISGGRPLQLLHVRFPGIAAGRGSDATLGFDQEGQRLPAGTYRLYALSDGPVHITVRAEGLARNVRLTAKTPISPRYRATSVPQSLDPKVGTPYGGLRRLPGVRSGPGDLAIARFGAAFAPGALTAEGWDFCITPPGDECTQLPGFDGYVFGIRSTGNTVDETAYFPPDLLPPGTYDVVAKCRAQQPALRCAMAVLDRYVSRDRLKSPTYL